LSYLLWHYLTEAAQRNPERLAVRASDGTLSYGELDAESDSVARALADASIGRGARVGLCAPRSIRAIPAMLGASKAGAAYVPLDHGMPARRGAFILEDCGVRALVTTARKLQEYRGHLPRLPTLELVILLDDEVGSTEVPAGVRILAWADLLRLGPGAPPAPAIESEPAYLLYTSGSTGKPKGVVLSHRHARTFVDWGRDAFDIGSEDRLSNHAPFHFDLSVFDIHVALSAGASVSIVPNAAGLFPRELARWIDAEGISVWYSVPSALVQLLLHGEMERFGFERLRTVLFAGEVFPVKYLRGVMEQIPRATFFNLYGPTETNVCTYYEVPSPLGDSVTEIPIGRPCANTEVFALDDEGREVGPGGTGELFVRGPTVMLGYWGLEERTCESLTPNPLQTSYPEPVYRTGDLVRQDEEGLYYFVGRRDHMVKSRGYRLELGEVEQALLAHDGVREAVVVAVPDEEIGNRLHAVVAAADGAELREGKLAAFLGERLPRYMIPESFRVFEALPRTSTGKLDRIEVTRQLEHPIELT
jgi:amino acid adenylation domain-containing protein